MNRNLILFRLEQKQGALHEQASKIRTILIREKPMIVHEKMV